MKALFVTVIVLALAGSAFARGSHSLFGRSITSDQLYSGGSSDSSASIEQALPVEITPVEIMPEEFESDGADDVEMSAVFTSAPILNPSPAMVPEPSTFATFALGGLVLGLVVLGRKIFWRPV